MVHQSCVLALVWSSTSNLDTGLPSFLFEVFGPYFGITVPGLSQVT